MNIESLYLLSQRLISVLDRTFKRYFIQNYSLDSQLSLILGARGVGKTTTLIQYMKRFTSDIFSQKILYIQADHVAIQALSLYEIAQEFDSNGGELLCIDEIHKAKDWTRDLKSIYDTFPDLRVIASGSSAIELEKGAFDLSRRALVYNMVGLSLREYLNITMGLTLNVISFDDIINKHQQISVQIIQELKTVNEKILPSFQRYLKIGYFPFFIKYPVIEEYQMILEQGINTILESDIPAIHPQLTGQSSKKMKQLLAYIASSVPYTPDLKKLKQLVDIGDERTLKQYLRYLEESNLIQTLTTSGAGMKQMEKPEKIYLGNTNFAFAIQDERTINIGTIRETFFMNMVSMHSTLKYSNIGDFFVDPKYLFEVGGKNKTYKQIKDILNSYIAMDDIESGINNKIPLWLFGFLY